MERKRRIRGSNGEPINVTEMGFRDFGEHWNEYLLDDGTVMRLKLVLLRVYRWDGHVNNRGEPVYITDSVNATSVSPIDNEEH